MKLLDLVSAHNSITLFLARGGGGGSSSHSSGGGSHSSYSSSGTYHSSGSGNDGVIIMMIIGALCVGFLPFLFVLKYLRRKVSFFKAYLIGLAIFIIYSIIAIYFGVFGIFLIVAGLLGFVIGLFIKPTTPKIKKLSAKALKNHAKSRDKDGNWTEKDLVKFVKDAFKRFQTDWSKFDIDSIKTYVAEPYNTHIDLMLMAIKLRNRRNDMQKIVIKNIAPVEIPEIDNPDYDRVGYTILASAKDSLIETIDGSEKVEFTDNGTFSEIWYFVRDGKTWKLEGIRQTTEELSEQNLAIKKFAEDNEYFYSLDWGWLLLPRRGVLFQKGTFGVSDINNHVIGVYRGIVIEIYSYVANPQRSKNGYVIAQVALPKSYGSIIVEAKVGRGSKTPKGYNKIELEWNDFNTRYNVYATDIEQVTAFELLHPIYMEKLFALPFKVSIEVVDNVVYLYTPDPSANYETMLSLLKDAFIEMRL